MATTTSIVRERLGAAAGRIRRVKRVDRLATWVITLGGAFIVVGVSFIFVFIVAEAVPLFRPAQAHQLGAIELGPGAGPDGDALAFGTDEYQRFVYSVGADAQVRFHDTRDGRLVESVPFPGLGQDRVVSASRSGTGDLVAAATADGRVALGQVRFRPVYQEQTLVDLARDVRARGVVDLDGSGRPARQVDYLEDGSSQVVAGLVGADEIALVQRDRDDETERRSTLRTRDADPVAFVRIGRSDAVAAVTRSGDLYHWSLEPEPRLTDVVRACEAAPTALEWALGGVSVLVADSSGGLSGWFRARLREGDSDLTLVQAHHMAGLSAPIVALGPSRRDKSFVAAASDGSLGVFHLTSERLLLELPSAGPVPDHVMLAPRGDGILAQSGARVARFDLDAAHPESSWRALFGRVWYEGYTRPEYVWQSTGSTSDFEPKLSLVPLIFGTIKATLYAMAFAMPLAIFGALYTSQFVHPSLRAYIKPVVEIMAALPSVVIGFIAGLWLASRVERDVVPVLLMMALLPLAGTAGVLVWGRLPRRVLRALRPGTELAVILPLLVLGGWLALGIGPGVEAWAFAGDFKHWLYGHFEIVYDQRNSLVVGLAMGFAVIPIIFTISEDAFSSVPSHLTAASLALGASRWQTAVRVVLPTASPGIFSAVMVGFGRAVGETMIVLMATGNTPVLDWSIFNGMRTLSANIAVEIPEAPHGGTLYRVLFLSAGVLFAMTFVVNTVAEVIRQRLRERYRVL